jgi:hypothetical protein
VSDDAAVCPKCDHVLDPSLYDDGPKPPRRSGVKSASGGMKSSKPKPAVKKTSGVKKEAPARRAMPDAPPRKLKTPPEMRAPVEDWHAPVRPLADPQANLQSQALDPEEAMGQARNFIVALSTSDRIAFWGAVATLIACFLPFRETVGEEESLGLLSLGSLVFAAHVGLITAIVVRVRKVLPRLNALVPWLLQFATSSFSIVWCLVLIKLFVNTQKARALYGNEEVWVSKPGVGVLLALVTSIAAFAGTLMGLREKPD